MKKLLITLAVAFLASCSSHKENTVGVGTGSTDTVSTDTTDTDTSVVAKGPAIQLSLVGGLKKSALLKSGVNTEVACPDSVDICLGDLYKSRAFYFILNNAGDSAITNLKITSTLSTWSITPSNIPVLNLPGKTSLTTLLTLGVGHGTPLFKVSDEPFQWDGIEGDGSVVDTLTFKWDGGEEKYTIALVARVVRFAWADEFHNKVELLGNCGITVQPMGGAPSGYGMLGARDTLTSWATDSEGVPYPKTSELFVQYHNGVISSDCMVVAPNNLWVWNDGGRIGSNLQNAPDDAMAGTDMSL